jgi:type IV secretory pathway TraG/TraD family ATPase VirD4
MFKLKQRNREVITIDTLLQDHLLITGRTGTGKSALLALALDEISDCEYPAVIFDPQGEHVSRFYRPGDKILNPMDSRSEYWTPWTDIREPLHSKEIAQSLLPGEQNDDLVKAARILLAAGLELTPTRSVEDLFEVLGNIVKTQLPELDDFGDVAHRISPDLNPTMMAYVTLLARAKSLKYLWLPDGKDGFSLRDWAQAPTGRLFITSSLDQHDFLGPLLSTWLALIASELLCRPEGADQKIFMVMDGLCYVNHSPVFPRLFMEGRSRGVICLAAIQLISQLQSKWGREAADSFFSSCHNFLSFAADFHTADYLKAAYGPKIALDLQRLRSGEAYVRWGRQDPPYIATAKIDCLELYRELPKVVPPYMEMDFAKTCWGPWDPKLTQ